MDDKENNIEDKKIYKSSELLLGMLQKEYEYDLNILNSLYSRTGITLALIGIFIGILLYKPINLKANLKIYNLVDCLIYSIPVITYFGSLIFILAAIFLLIKVLLSTKSKRVDVSKGFDEERALMQRELICYYMMDKYKELLVYNKSIADSKFKNYDRAIKCLSTSLIFFIFYSIYYLN